MDAAMKRLWRGMGPLPGDLRLYGGTALALYLDHRQSTDFDFVTPAAVVDLAFVRRLPWLQGAALRGGPGMVDAVIHDAQRPIRATFMESGHIVPTPAKKPICAPNGVMVAHPLDLVAAKVEACCNRGAARDYADVAASVIAWPHWCLQGCRLLRDRPLSTIARTLAAPPSGVEADALPALQDFAARMAVMERGLDPP